MDLDRVAAALGEALAHTGRWAPAILLFASFVEYVFPPFPGDLVVVLGAWYAVEGKISWLAAFAAVTAGAIAGCFVDYAFGRWLAPRLSARASRRGAISASRLERFSLAYRRWGPALLVLNRFLPGIRGFIFVAAGAARLPLGQVLLLGGISAAVWNALLLAAGRLLVRSLPELLALFQRYSEAAWVAVGAVALAAAVWAWRRVGRRARAPDEDAP